MIIVMSSGATPEELEKVENAVRKLGYTPHEIVGVEFVFGRSLCRFNSIRACNATTI